MTILHYFRTPNKLAAASQSNLPSAFRIRIFNTWKPIKIRIFSTFYHFNFAFDLARPTDEMWNLSKLI